MRLRSGDVLLIVDVQNDFCSGGALAVPNGEQVVPVINAIAGEFDHALLTQDWHPAGHSSFAATHPGRAPFEVMEAPYGPQVLWPDHCIQGTPGAQFHAELDVPRAELVIRKGFRREIDSYSAFLENDKRTRTGLAGFLRDRELTRIFLAGLATDFCVAWSALDARGEGFAAVLIEDACRAIDLNGSLAHAREQLRDAGVEVVRSTDLAR